jgi:Flp pilus assembly protein TadD/uncharacterized protein (AIM24 family)
MVDTEPPPSIRSLVSHTDAIANAEEHAPPSDVPSVSSFDGEDFLYHLYRGSELLQDNLVGEAKEELERALALQPRDVEGQGLLGVVYFRLGLYPRAIEIYEQITKNCPDEVTPWLNLGLCYLKTGQNARAREVLEDVTRKVPDHRRAWGYLGLAHERMGATDRALDAFERAGQAHMVRRLQRARGSDADVEEAQDSERPERQAIRKAAADAIMELEGDLRPFSRVPAADADDDALRTGRWHAMEPGNARLPAAPRARRASPLAAEPPPSRTPAELSSALGVGNSQPTRLATELFVLRSTTAVAARGDLVRALRPDEGVFRPSQLNRRSLGKESAEPLGGPRHPVVKLSGRGGVVLVAPKGLSLYSTELSDEFFYVREERLVGFDEEMRYECGRLPLAPGDHAPMVQLSGTGVLVLAATTRLTTLPVTPDAGAWSRAEDVVGWTGRLMPNPVPQDAVPVATGRWLRFSGEGVLWLDAG